MKVMRISMWQQFASNNSTSFTVVGKFESAEDAERAAFELRHVMRLLGEARRNHGIEAELQVKYPVSWTSDIDWSYWVEYNDEDDPVSTFRDIVVINQPHPSIWYGPQPFDEILKRLGGDVAVNVSESRSAPDSVLTIQVVFDAPNTEVAETLEQQLKQYLQAKWDEPVPPPWLVYHHGKLDPAADDLRFLTPFYISEHQTFRRETLGGRLYRQLNSAIRSENTKQEKLIREEYDKQYRAGQIHLTIEQVGWIEDALDATEVTKYYYEETTNVHPHVERSGTHIDVSGLVFDELREPLMAVILWLEGQGCRNIQYLFHERRDLQWDT
jgi:hypothetical protein